MKDMNIVSFLLFLWNWISSLCFFFLVEFLPSPGAREGGAFGQNIYPWMQYYGQYNLIRGERSYNVIVDIPEFCIFPFNWCKILDEP